MAYCPKREQVKKDLIERGKMFEELHGRQALKFYSGRASQILPIDDPFGMYGIHGRQRKQKKYSPYNGRIIVDTEAYYALQEDCTPKLRPLESLGKDDSYTAINGNDDETKSIATIDSGKQEGGDNGRRVSLTDDERMFTVSQVKVFSLKDRHWCQFYVTSIQDVVWVPDAVDKLVLGPEEKILLLALVSSKEGNMNTGFDDFISNKGPFRIATSRRRKIMLASKIGKGLIILLSGPPRVGKTLTAEAVAEKIQRPLYRLSAGDLGSTVRDVEHNLQKALNRCAHWNAVLLIDEADVNLEARSVDNLDRNELVSSFLRLLEYYEGIMILTTNRISSIDPAFESRIDISLPYQDLDRDARAQVWREFLTTQKDSQVFDSDIDNVLSERALNGRKIKSAIKTACILASSEQTTLALRHLLVVLNVRDNARALLGI
ncbi:P-loop containing nucleoside triphosphate hydrolase protein [Xylariaceae sp. FL0255]|nr:P-loop containing nucleoside triphosphate hydrolase protein [Xylariaceae sp. FL0255]